MAKYSPAVKIELPGASLLFVTGPDCPPMHKAT
jgi:hypothetical protein